MLHKLSLNQSCFFLVHSNVHAFLTHLNMNFNILFISWKSRKTHMCANHEYQLTYSIFLTLTFNMAPRNDAVKLATSHVKINAFSKTQNSIYSPIKTSTCIYSLLGLVFDNNENNSHGLVIPMPCVTYQLALSMLIITLTRVLNQIKPQKTNPLVTAVWSSLLTTSDT